MVSVETVPNWYGINIPTDGCTDATPYVGQVVKINKGTEENSMSEKFKIGDRVRDLEWKNGKNVGTIVKSFGNGSYQVDYSPHSYGLCGGEENGVGNSRLELVEEKLEIGSKYVIANKDDVFVDGVDACEVIGIYDGNYIIEFNDGEITRAWQVGQEKDFLDCWKLYKEPETITRWTYVYKFFGKAVIDVSTYETEKDAINNCKEFCPELIKTIKIEYTPE